MEELKTVLSLELEKNNMSLVSLEYKIDEKILLLTIDKNGYVDIDDITKATDLANSILDKLDPIKEEYSLMVESVGVEKVFKVEDASSYLGEYVLIESYNKTYLGTLLEKSIDYIVIKNKKNKKEKIYLEDIKEIRTTVLF